MAQRRPSWTLLFATAERVLRVDVGDAPDFAPQFTREIALTKRRLDDAVREAVAGRPKPAPRTYLLYSGAWTQTVDLPAQTVGALSEDDLARALAFELEPVSGIAPADSALGFLKLTNTAAGKSRFWATQMRASTRDAVAEVLRARGSRLEGVSHPTGLQAGAGLRCEVWEQTTAFGGANDTHRRVVAARAGSRLWDQGFQEWFREIAAALDGSPIEWRGILRSADVVRDAHGRLIADRGALDADLDPTEWLRSVAPSLIDDSKMPRVPPPARARLRVRPWIAAVAAAAGTGAWMAWDYVDLQTRVAAADARAKEADELTAGAARAATAAADLTRAAAKVTNENQRLSLALQFAEAECAAQRERIPALLKSAADRTPAEVTLTKITAEAGGNIKIIGTAPSVHAVGVFASALSGALAKDRWRLEPAESKERVDDDGDVVIEMSITIEPAAAERAAFEKWLSLVERDAKSAVKPTGRL